MSIAAYGRHTEAGIARRRLEAQRAAMQPQITREQPTEQAQPAVAGEPEQSVVIPIATPAMQTRALIDSVAQSFGCTYADIIGLSRKPHMVKARFAAIRAVKEANQSLSLPALGRVFHRDHTSIIYALEQAGASKPRSNVPAQPIEALRAADLVPQGTATLQALISAYPGSVSTQGLIDVLYGEKALPQFPDRVVRMNASRVRKAVAAFGWTIPNADPGPEGPVYRLEPNQQ